MQWAANPWRRNLAVNDRQLGVAERCRRRLCHEVWNIGLIDQPATDIVARGILAPVRWLSGLPRGMMFADPSCLEYSDGRRMVFVEAMNCRVGRGEIWSADLAPGETPTYSSFEPILRAPYHLSYPFPILDEGRPILTAESWQAGKTTVWRQGDGRWRADGTLLAGRQVLDPTLWRGPDGWWLFCTFRDDGPDSCLHVFSSNSLQGPWSNHPRNPVITDFGGARPAGPLFVAGDQLIRPAQDCSQTYGGAVVPECCPPSGHARI